jgi:hypothetical protein
LLSSENADTEALTEVPAAGMNAASIPKDWLVKEGDMQARPLIADQDSPAILLAKIDTLIQAERGEESKESIQLLREKLPHVATMFHGLKFVSEL